MRKLFTLSVLFFSIYSSHAQLLRGLDAAKLFQNADEVLMNKDGNKPEYIHFNSQSNLYFENFNYWALNHLGLKGNNTLVQIGLETDQLGMIHYRYQQYFNGKPIQYSMIIVHTLNGKVISLNGEYFQNLTDNYQSNLTEAEALEKALVKVNASIYAWQDMMQESVIKFIENSASASYYPKGELVYVSKNNSLKNEDFRLSYKFNIYANEPMSRANIFVDASNGDILFTENLIHTSNAKGTAHTRYSGVRPFTTDSTSPTNFRLRETGRGNGIETYNFHRGTSTGAATDFTDTDNDWNNIDTLQDEVATDAHWGAEMTYDYYKTTYNRNSINNNGMKLLSYVHYSTNYNNAFWNGQYMTYGDGNGTLFTPLTAIDVCGHEITHGLTSNTANLVYQNEPGGLNESFSDIFGTTIEFYGRNGLGNWKIGEDMTPGGAGIRSMQNPKLFSDPNTYIGTYWVPANGTDNGGVHTNSGVQNYWYYLMCQGGGGTNDNSKVYNVPGMGMLKAAAITFRSLTIYLTPNSQFSNARFYSILAAKDLFGQCATEVKITTNTWAAVGVGNDFDSTVKALFSSNDTLICGPNGTAAFINGSTNAATSVWDFGDGSAKSSLTNPSHTYAAVGNYTVKLVVGSCSTPVKYDSMTLVTYIKVSTTSPYCLAQKMPVGTGTGTTITLCSGKLMDDGGLNNYADNVNSKRTIAPTGAGYIRIKFNSFDFENTYDFLYIYDGPTTASPLIGKFTGSTLPNGGNIATSGGSVTFVETTDPAVEGTGFDLDWQCYPKSSSDISVISVIPIKSLRQNTPLFKDSSYVTALIRNSGTVAQSNIPVSYSVNGGIAVSAVSPPGLLLPNNIDTIVFSTPITNNVGVYNVKVFSTLSTDTVHFNDTAFTSFKIVENDPVTLPFTEGFEGMGPDSSNKNVFSLTGAGKLDYDNNDSLNNERFRNTPLNIATHSGSRMITFDRTNDNTTDAFSNFLTLTLNLTKYIGPNSIYFDFYYKSEGDEQQANDKVWIRGNMNNSWIEVYTLIPNNTFPAAIWYFVKGIRIDSILSAHGQSLSTNTQIRWGQQDNNMASNETSTDGISFDDIRVYIKSSNDVSVISILPIKSQRQNTPAFNDSSTVTAIIKNVGTAAQSNIPVSYSVNGGANVSAVSPPGLLLPNAIDTVVFSTPIANNIGVYNLKVFSTLSTDTVHFNDTASTTFKIVENDPVTLPFTEGFEGMGPDSSNYNVFSLTGAGKLDYDNDDSLNYERFRNTPLNIATHNGLRMITFDRTLNNTDAFSNFLTLTLNLSKYVTQNKVYLDFYYKSEGDEMQANDKVWIRGNMNDSWIEVYTLIPNDAFPAAIWYFIKGIRLDSILTANGQSLSTNTQIRWGQQDNNVASTETGTDGISFDDIKVYNVSMVGINKIQFNNNDIQIYPNPAKNEVGIYGLTEKSTITVMDATGKVILVTDSNKNISINTSNLSRGIYLLNISNEHFNETKKLIIE